MRHVDFSGVRHFRSLTAKHKAHSSFHQLATWSPSDITICSHINNSDTHCFFYTLDIFTINVLTSSLWNTGSKRLQWVKICFKSKSIYALTNTWRQNHEKKVIWVVLPDRFWAAFSATLSSVLATLWSALNQSERGLHTLSLMTELCWENKKTHWTHHWKGEKKDGGEDKHRQCSTDRKIHFIFPIFSLGGNETGSCTKDLTTQKLKHSILAQIYVELSVERGLLQVTQPAQSFTTTHLDNTVKEI